MSRIKAITKIIAVDLERWQVRLLFRLAAENKCDIDELVAQIVQEWIMAGKGAMNRSRGDAMTVTFGSSNIPDGTPQKEMTGADE